MGGKHVSQAGRVPVGRQSRGEHDRQGFSILSFRKSERGQELAEFAILLPVFFLLIFAALDLGRLFFASISIANAAREGARYGGLHRDDITFTVGTCDAPPSNIIQATCQEGQNSLINPANMSVNPACPDAGGCAPYNRVVVTVTYDFDLLLGAVIGADGIQLTRSAEMMLQ